LIYNLERRSAVNIVSGSIDPDIQQRAAKAKAIALSTDYISFQHDQQKNNQGNACEQGITVEKNYLFHKSS